MPYNRRALIVVEYTTREKLKDVATYRQTYNDLIIELLKLREQQQGKRIDKNAE